MDVRTRLFGLIRRCVSRGLAEAPALGVVAAGGVIGALARHGVDRLLPRDPGDWAWSTLLINATGCLLIGVLAAVADRGAVPVLSRAFLGVGVLGGYTTFSAASLETLLLADTAGAAWALLYTLVTLSSAIFAVTGGRLATETLIRRVCDHQ